MVASRDFFRFERALVLAPHTDDGEFGCGGTIARLLDAGTEVFYIAFSICEESVSKEFRSDILASEVMDATAALGIAASNVQVHRFPVRRFLEHRQDILEKIVVAAHEITPDLVILPSGYDIHQDHAVIHQEGIRALRNTTIIGYEFPRNNLEMAAALYVRLDESHLQRKREATDKYLSQVHRALQYEGSLMLAKFRGHQIGVDFAEAFQVIRWVI